MSCLNVLLGDMNVQRCRHVSLDSINQDVRGEIKEHGQRSRSLVQIFINPSNYSFLSQYIM